MAALAAAGCHGNRGAPPDSPRSAQAAAPATPAPSSATLRLGDALVIENESGAPLCVTGVLLNAGEPAQPLYHGILSGGLDVTRPRPPLKGRVLRLRFTAAGPQFELYSKRLRQPLDRVPHAGSEAVAGEVVAELARETKADAKGTTIASFTEWQPPAAEAASVPEIELGGDVAEYLLGEGERTQGSGTDPIEVHVVRRAGRLVTMTKTSSRVRTGKSGFTFEDRGDSLAVYREGSDVPLLIQRNEAGARPCLHPLMAPDLDGVLTEFMPDHHHHQTGVYFGLPEVNGRSYFHTTRQGYFARVGHFMLKGRNDAIGRWTIADEWLGERGPVATETQSWRLEDHGSWYVLDLDWSLLAHEEVTVGKYDYGGLFVRMAWRAETGGRAVNSEGQEGAACEGQRARWVDVSVPIAGRGDGKAGHIALLDHPKNEGHPEPFRVDDQLGFGPCRARLGEWKIARSKSASAKFRLVIYLGEFDRERIEGAWKGFAEAK
jgi:methane monooxygenase PmoA-like